MTTVNLSGNGWDQETVDRAIDNIYAGRRNYTGAALELDISGNAPPSGMYQEVCPPTTALEKVYQLENDGCEEGIQVWSINYGIGE